jgi:DNA-binding response OmpR family regulator
MNATAASSRRPILLIEDNDADATLLTRAFEKSAPGVAIHRVKSGEDALAYVMGLKKFADRIHYPDPGLVLLDLHLPDLAGLQILNVIRHHKAVARVPVVVLSGTDNPDTVANAYDAGASSFVVKQFEPALLEKLARAIVSYWLEFNQVPERTTK